MVALFGCKANVGSIFLPSAAYPTALAICCTWNPNWYQRSHWKQYLPEVEDHRHLACKVKDSENGGQDSKLCHRNDRRTGGDRARNGLTGSHKTVHGPI